MARRLMLEAPRSRVALLRGMDQMTALLRPTLGPIARTVAVQGMSKTSAPEILDSAATIARRTVQLSDPFEDMGGMIVRQMVWTVFEEVGDGSATAAVLCQELMHAASPYIAAGGNAMLIKRGIERGLRIALDELRGQARPIELPSEIARSVAGTLRDDALAELIGETIESVGPDGAVLIEDAPGTRTTVEYIEGVRWDGGYHSYYLLREGSPHTRLMNPRIFITDSNLTQAEQLVPLLEVCAAAGERNLLIIAPEVSDSALALLVINRDKGLFDEVMAAKAPSIGEQRDKILADLATTTGGRAFSADGGDRIEEVILEDLGRARQAWVTDRTFGILGGAGAKGAVRQRINEVKAELREAKGDDNLRKSLQERIGKLAGAAATVYVAAPTSAEQAELRSRVEAAVTSARAALRDGVVPGGGAAFLGCVPALERFGAGLTGDEAFGVAILARALTGPMAAIARNAGLDPQPLIAEAREHGAGWTFDALRREWVDAWEAGILDPLPVAQTTLQTSVSAATMALTTDVLVRHKKPELATNP
ncbi:MAG: Heat shock protein 60 family chaperone GroEL [uncultured Thermomicrobiales bacterium]|uniref:60 kDa chaperonin n=1 Tax=uncultured Thermomicrobiales bacterium TaxID=1645740 RepID=A0A6J4UJX0_9BACT|nr:MAG: Heat shock protein 60 family chaperone GroEL [uncultured Thermomicrobiales bacterium]